MKGMGIQLSHNTAHQLGPNLFVVTYCKPWVEGFKVLWTKPEPD